MESEPKLEMLYEDAKTCIITHLEQKEYTNININIEPGSNLGDNFMGFIGKLTITAADKNNKGEIKTFNWIVKTAPNFGPYRTALNIEQTYQRESYIYKEVLPIFHALQKEKRVLNPFHQYPKFILSYLENSQETIVMENIKCDGYVMRSRQEPLDLNHVKLVMKAYGKLHALSYVLKDQKPDVFKSIAENIPDVLQNTITDEHIREYQKPGLELSVKVLEDSKTPGDILKIYKKFVDNYVDIVIQLLQETNDYSVIGHGDSWVNNMLWKYDLPDPKIPTKVCLLDWQLARYNSPACDLSYFMFTCTTKEFRDEHYDNMIKLYYYTLCEHIVELGSDPEKLFPFDALLGELQKYSLVGIYMSVMLLRVITRENIPEWRSEDVNPDEVQQQWNEDDKNADVYATRVKGVITDAYKKGYFKRLM